MALLFVLALLPRLALVLSFPPDDMKFSDRHYIEYARNFAEGRGFYGGNPYGGGGPERVYAFRPPLFPLVWALTYRVTGGAYTPLRLVFAFLSALGGVLVYRLGLRLFRAPAVALVGTIIYAFYPPLIWHGVQLMTEPLFILFVLATVLFLLRTYDMGQLVDAVLAGLTWALATLTRSAFLGFAVVSLGWVLLVVRTDWCRRVTMAAVFAGAGLLALSPWIVRNAIVLRAFVPTTTDGGHGFYVANHPQVLRDPYARERGFYMPKPEEWDAELDLRGAQLSEVEMQQRLYARALEYLWHHPGEWARLLWGRFLTFWRFYPRSTFVGRTETIIYGISYVPIFFLAVVGWILAHARLEHYRAKYLLIDLLVGYTAVVHIVFLVMLRYREPLMPFLILFAAYAVYCLWRWRLGSREGATA